jgi:hypothetical protein
MIYYKCYGFVMELFVVFNGFIVLCMICFDGIIKLVSWICEVLSLYIFE